MKVICRVALLALPVFFQLVANAQVFKCVQADGSIAYQPAPCQQNTAQQVLKNNGRFVEPNSSTQSNSGQSKPSPSLPAETTGEPGGATQPNQPNASAQAKGTQAPASAASALAPAEPKAKESAVSTIKKLIGGSTVALIVGILLLALIVTATLWFIRFLTNFLAPGRNGLFICVVAIFVSILFLAIFTAAGGVLGKFKFLSIFASALVYMWLFKTSYGKSVLISILVFGLVFALSSQAPGAMSKPAAITAFSPPDLSFSIGMPGTPREMPTTQPADGGKARMYRLQTADADYAVAFVDHPAPPANVSDFLDQARDMMSMNGKLTLTQERRIRIEGHEGRDLLFRMQGGYGRYRVFFVGARMYTLMVVMPPGTETLPKFEAYLDSFHLK